jgi:hypothetical protein
VHVILRCLDRVFELASRRLSLCWMDEAEIGDCWVVVADGDVGEGLANAGPHGAENWTKSKNKRGVENGDPGKLRVKELVGMGIAVVMQVVEAIGS